MIILDQFKATELYNSCLEELLKFFYQSKDLNLSGKEIFTITFNYFINNGRTEVNGDKILKVI